MLNHGLWFASHVTISCCFFVDRGTKFESALYAIRSHVEDSVETVGDFLVGKIDVACAVGVDEEAHRLGYADGVSHLHENFVGNSGSYGVFSHVSSGVSSRAVDLAGVFARESASTMSAAASVGVDNDFATSEAGVAVRATDNEFSGWVDVIGDIFVE